LRCRECGKSFDQWSWGNPVCPACLGQASPDSLADVAPPLSDDANIIDDSHSSLVSSESALDDFRIDTPLGAQSVDDVLLSPMSAPASRETDIGENDARSESYLTKNIGGDFGMEEKDSHSLIEPSMLGIEMSSLTPETPVSMKAIEVPTGQIDLTPDPKNLLEAESSILGAGTSDLLGEGMTDEEFHKIEHRSTYDPPSPQPLPEIHQIDLSDSEESFFENSESIPAENELNESTMPKWGDESPVEADEELFEDDEGVVSVADFLQDDITVISSSEEIPEGIPVAQEFIDDEQFPAQEPIDILIEQPENIPIAKRFFHEQDGEFQAGDAGIPLEDRNRIRAAEVAMPGELRSHIQSFESPSGRYSIDFAEGKFLRMEMIAEGMGGWNLMVFITLLTITIITVATGPFFIIFLPFLFLYGIRLALRIFTTEKLYVEDNGIRHEIFLVPGFALKWEREYTPNLTILRTNDPFRFFRSRDKSGNRKDDMLFLVGDDWRERVGFLTDEQEARWLASHLHRFLRKVRYVH